MGEGGAIGVEKGDEGPFPLEGRVILLEWGVILLERRVILLEQRVVLLE